MIKFYGRPDPKVRWTQEAVDRLFGSCPRACLSGGGWGGCSGGPRGARGSRRHPPPSGSMSCHPLASFVPSILSLPLVICPAHVCERFSFRPPPLIPVSSTSLGFLIPLLSHPPSYFTLPDHGRPPHSCLPPHRPHRALEAPDVPGGGQARGGAPSRHRLHRSRILRMVATHVVKLVPPHNQANMFKAQRFLRTVREGCFSRPVFCISICELHFVPVG